jgi:hypothetical protein
MDVLISADARFVSTNRKLERQAKTIARTASIGPIRTTTRVNNIVLSVRHSLRASLIKYNALPSPTTRVPESRPTLPPYHQGHSGWYELAGRFFYYRVYGPDDWEPVLGPVSEAEMEATAPALNLLPMDPEQTQRHFAAVEVQRTVRGGLVRVRTRPLLRRLRRFRGLLPLCRAGLGIGLASGVGLVPGDAPCPAQEGGGGGGPGGEEASRHAVAAQTKQLARAEEQLYEAVATCIPVSREGGAEGQQQGQQQGQGQQGQGQQGGGGGWWGGAARVAPHVRPRYGDR